MIASSPHHIRIGTRGSALALWQANTVKAALEHRWQDSTFELVIIKPEGDLDKHSSLTSIGGRGVFTSGLQVELLDGRIDMAVHSTKDLPSLHPAGLAVAAFLAREDPRDALISRHRVGLADLPANPVVGTSSRRRSAQILAKRPDAVIRELRGNIDTRLKKAQAGDYDAIVLASAGLTRMGWDEAITELLSVEISCPAPGQGVLAIEARDDDGLGWQCAASLDDADVRTSVNVERAFLRGVGGGCTTPIGAHARLERMHGMATVRFWGMLADDDGQNIQRIYEEWPADAAETRAFECAKRLLADVSPQGVMAKRVLITGTPSIRASASDAFASAGAHVIEAPTVDIELGDPDTVRRQVTDVNPDWLFITSPNGVQAVAQTLPLLDDRVRIGVVGSRTAQSLIAHGRIPDLVGEGPGAAALTEALHGVRVSDASVVCIQSDRARSTLTDWLTEHGARVTPVVAYRTVAVDALPEDVLSTIAAGDIDIVTFASPSSVEAFRRMVGAHMPALSSASFIAIGPTTSDALHDADLPVHGVAHTPSGEGLFAAAISSLTSVSKEHRLG